MTDFDSPWKEILEQYFPEFMAFPQAYQDIDWSRGYESLDKELQQIVRDAELGRRLADKLIRVWRKPGQEQLVLIPIEVQGEAEQDFEQRIYVYNYRLFDRYRRPVVSLVVLSDPSPTWGPQRYGYSLWGCQVGIEFPGVKLRDFAARWAELESSDNPFVTVVMAHLKTQATRCHPQQRLRWKLALVRRMYERGYPRQAILDLFRFIDWVLVLPQGVEERFQVELERLKTESNMPYITSIERSGIEKGLQQGLQQGFQRGEAHMLKRQLSRRFGPLPDWVEQRLEQAQPQALEVWAERVLEAQTLNEVFDTPA